MPSAPRYAPSTLLCESARRKPRRDVSASVPERVAFGATAFAGAAALRALATGAISL